MSDSADLALRLAVAGLCGLAVGVEREWSARQRGRGHEFAGVRTLFLLGLLGGLAAEIGSAWPWVATALVAAAAAIPVVGFIAAMHRDDDATTEVAALLVIAAAFLAGLGSLALAAAVAAVTALVLVEKSRIHALVFRLRSQEIEAGLRFAVLAAVVLPLLPAGPFGPPPGIRPRELWALVLVFSGLSFAGYLGLRAVGGHRGYGVAGMLGGLLSSTAVTLTFARDSRARPDDARGLATGALAASTVLCVRLPVLAGFLRPELGLRVALLLLLPLATGAVLVALALRGRAGQDVATVLPDNPLRLGSALQMAALFQVVLYGLDFVRGRFGAAGVLGSAALLGLTDMDALTFSIARSGALDVVVAARALAVGALANTILKLALAVALGAPAYRWRVGAGLAALGAATVGSLLLS